MPPEPLAGSFSDPALGHPAFDPALLTDEVVVPRDASTLIVVRGGGTAEPVPKGDRGVPAPAGAGRWGPLEVLLLRKTIKAEFAGGAHVFPGGSVDEADRNPEMARLCAGRDDADASVQLGIESGGLAFWIAAVRECFEEAGILLAYGPGGELVSMSDPSVARRFHVYRDEVNRDPQAFSRICAEEGLRVAADRIHYFSHWITPVGAPRRYDTRFFVVEAPAGQTALNDGSETVENIWITPEDALGRSLAGTMALVYPTIKSLEAIGRFGSAAEAIAAARAIEEIPASIPRIAVDGREVRILLPGDAGYEEVEGSMFRPDPAP